jgi:hypothetical protein
LKRNDKVAVGQRHNFHQAAKTELTQLLSQAQALYLIELIEVILYVLIADLANYARLDWKFILFKL